MHLFGKKFLEAFTAERNLLRGNIWCYCTFVPPLGLGLGLRLALNRVSSWWVINNKREIRKWNSALEVALGCSRKVHLSSCSRLETYHYQARRAFSIFWDYWLREAWKLTEILKKPTSFVLEQFILQRVYRTVQYWWCSLDFPENEGDSRKLNKVHKLVQRFSEQCKHYVPKQNITLRSINYEAKKRKGKKKTVLCIQIWNKPLQNLVWPYVACRAMLGKTSEPIYK